MRILKFKKALRTTLGSYDIGDMVYEDTSDATTPIFHPFKGGYPLWEKEGFLFVNDYLEFVEDTDKPEVSLPI